MMSRKQFTPTKNSSVPKNEIPLSQGRSLLRLRSRSRLGVFVLSNLFILLTDSKVIFAQGRGEISDEALQILSAARSDSAGSRVPRAADPQTDPKLTAAARLGDECGQNPNCFGIYSVRISPTGPFAHSNNPCHEMDGEQKTFCQAAFIKAVKLRIKNSEPGSACISSFREGEITAENDCNTLAQQTGCPQQIKVGQPGDLGCFNYGYSRTAQSCVDRLRAAGIAPTPPGNSVGGVAQASDRRLKDLWEWVRARAKTFYNTATGATGAKAE